MTALIEARSVSKRFRQHRRFPGLLGAFKTLVTSEYTEVAAVSDISFDITAGVRNLRGKRDRIVAPGDYDRYDDATMSTTTIPVVPGEGREFYVKVGYRY